MYVDILITVPITIKFKNKVSVLSCLFNYYVVLTSKDYNNCVEGLLLTKFGLVTLVSLYQGSQFEKFPLQKIFG